MKPVKKRLPAEFISPTASSIGKVEPSLRSADDDAADADDPPLAGAQVAVEIAVVLLAIGIRHQPLTFEPMTSCAA